MLSKVCILLFCCLSSHIYAQFWESTNGPGGGSISATIASPFGEVFAFSTVRFRSTDRGGTWHQKPLNIPSSAGAVFQMKWVSPTTVYMVTQASSTKALWKSVDGGNTWTFNRPLHVFSGLAVTRSGKLIVSMYDSVQTSTDGGDNWSSTKPSGYFYSNHYMFVDRDGNAFIGAYNSVYRSTDEGTTWERIINGLPGLNGEIKFASANSGMVLLTEFYRIHASTDGGYSWNVTYQGTDAIADICSASRDTVFIITTQGAVERSLDGGKTWTPFSPPFSPIPYAVPRDLFIMGDELFATIMGGLYKKDIKTQGDWQAVTLPTGTVTNLAITPSGTVYAITSLGAGSRTSKLWHLDSSQRWNEKKITIPTSSGVYDLYDLAIDSSGDLCALFESYFIKSTDQGRSWKQTLYVLITPCKLTATEDRLFVASPLEGVFFSSDGGQLWNFANSGITNPSLRCIAAADGHVYAGAFQTYFRSSNNGYSWEEPIFPFISGSGTVRKIDAFKESVVLGVDLTGVYFSEDHGSTWKNHSTGLALDTIFDLRITPRGNVLAATSSGVYEYYPTTKAWQNVNDGILNGPVYSLALGPDGTMYAGTKGNGVYRSTKNYGTWATRSVRSDQASGDIRLYPNPASSEVYLRSTSQTYKVRIFNLLGEVVFSGANTQRIDISSLSAGQYFVRILADGSTTTLPLCITR